MEKQIETSQLDIKTIREIQMNILDVIHLFCASNNIRYSIACGTLLGAVRHKGYIPWDDDIDIYLLRSDYEKLIRAFPYNYDGRYDLISLERDPTWDRPYAKAYDNRTTLFENSMSSARIGVNIDVYPIDEVPDKQRKWMRYDSIRRIYQNIDSLCRMRVDKNRGIMKNLVVSFFKIPGILFSRRSFAVFLSNFAQKNNGKGYLYVFECVQGLLQKNRFRKSLFDELSNYEFDGHTFWGFKDYDEYLRNGYGDYWILPPVEKRVSHHDYYACWN